MNKKSVLIGVLAALMLFAFVACDSNSTAQAGRVVALSAVQNVTYVIGEEAYPADFTWTGVTELGDIVTVDASLVSFVNPVIDAEEDELQAKYAADIYGVQPSTIKVEAEKVTGLTVAASGKAVSYYAELSAGETPDKLVKDGVVATVQYEGGEKELSADEITLAAPAEFDWTETVTGAKMTVSMTHNSEAPTATFDFNVVDNLVDSIAVKTTNNYKIYVGDTVTTATKKTANYAEDGATDADGGFYVELRYQGGQTDVADQSDLSFKTLSDANYTKSTIPTGMIPSTTGTASFNVRYDGDDVREGLSTAYVVELAVEKDSVTSVSIEDPAAGLSAIDYTNADPGFTVTVKLASGDAYSTEIAYKTANDSVKTDNYYTISPANFTSVTAPGARQTITFTVHVNNQVLTSTKGVFVKAN